jgi:hypothetical protein
MVPKIEFDNEFFEVFLYFKGSFNLFVVGGLVEISNVFFQVFEVAFKSFFWRSVNEVVVLALQCIPTTEIENSTGHMDHSLVKCLLLKTFICIPFIRASN